MNISEIVEDAVRYPFSDWKKILILGIIMIFASLSSILQSVIPSNVGLKLILFVVGVILIGFFARGYQYRIIKSSLSNINILPEFNDWVNMLIDGIKVFIVNIIYLIPGILIIAVAALSILTQIGSISSNLSAYDINIILNSIGIISIAILYFIVIIPIMYVAIAHMANNDSKLSAAFRFREILTKISTIGWVDLLIWYIITGIIFLVLLFVGSIITSIIGRLIFVPLGLILMSLLVTPYIYMYLSRSVALFYMSK